MNDSGQAVRDALRHRQPAKVPLDINGTLVSGMHASCVAALRRRYGLSDAPVRMYDVFLGLGYMEPDLLGAMGVDVQAPLPLADNFGNRFSPLADWKEMPTPWGQTVLVPGSFAWSVAENGDYYGYPSGDAAAAPSAHMPKSGFFFDAVIRQEEIGDDDELDPADNLEEHRLLSDDDLDFIAQAAEAAVASADGRAIVGSTPNTGLGDICHIPGVSLSRPKGIRDVEEWYVSLVTRQDHVRAIFARQTEIALENMRRIHKRVGDVYDAVIVCGADYGTQTGQFCSADALRELQMPFYQKINGWIHEHTGWKTMKHTCGAVEPLLDVLIESGFDILNPVQCSASGMDPAMLKKKYGDRLVFWGGGVNTQKTLPFGTPEDVRREVLERCRVFSAGGGFVFAAIHNIQAGTPTENIVAMVDAVREFNGEKR